MLHPPDSRTQHLETNVPIYGMNGTLVSSDMTKVYSYHRLNELFARLARVRNLKSLQAIFAENIVHHERQE